jgi:hypothetical protein
MASKKVAITPTPAQEKDELLDELSVFLYDAYRHSKKENGKIELGKGQNAENGEST